MMGGRAKRSQRATLASLRQDSSRRPHGNDRHHQQEPQHQQQQRGQDVGDHTMAMMMEMERQMHHIPQHHVHHNNHMLPAPPPPLHIAPVSNEEQELRIGIEVAKQEPRQLDLTQAIATEAAGADAIDPWHTRETWEEGQSAGTGEGGDDESDEGDGVPGSMRPAPPGLGAATLWAREATSMKRCREQASEAGASDEGMSSSFTSITRMTPTTVPMPSTNKELAVLIRDVVGARPKYGDESARPAYWPDDVPWKKGKSISQMNNLTLRRLAKAVVQHQARARERSRLMGGNVVPIGGVGCGRRTKKELSALIRSKLGLRLQYGEKGRRPAFWPADVPWKKGKPLSMMNHGELSSVFSAMVGAGLCPAGACIDPPHIYQISEGSDSSGSVSIDEWTTDNNQQSQPASSSATSSSATALPSSSYFSSSSSSSSSCTEAGGGGGGGGDGGGSGGGSASWGDDSYSIAMKQQTMNHEDTIADEMYLGDDGNPSTFTGYQGEQSGDGVGMTAGGEDYDGDSDWQVSLEAALSRDNAAAGGGPGELIDESVSAVVEPSEMFLEKAETPTLSDYDLTFPSSAAAGGAISGYGTTNGTAGGNLPTFPGSRGGCTMLGAGSMPSFPSLDSLTNVNMAGSAASTSNMGYFGAFGSAPAATAAIAQGGGVVHPGSFANAAAASSSAMLPPSFSKEFYQHAKHEMSGPLAQPMNLGEIRPHPHDVFHDAWTVGEEF